MRGQDFVDAIVEMYESGELDKIAKVKPDQICASRIYAWKERKEAKAFKEMLDEVRANERELDKIPFVPLLMSIKSTEVLKSAICLMIGQNHDESMF